MAHELHVLVFPRDNFGSRHQLSQRLSAQLVYIRELPAQDGSTGEGKAVCLESALKAELDPTGCTSLVLDDRAPGTPTQ